MIVLNLDSYISGIVIRNYVKQNQAEFWQNLLRPAFKFLETTLALQLQILVFWNLKTFQYFPSLHGFNPAFIQYLEVPQQVPERLYNLRIWKQAVIKNIIPCNQLRKAALSINSTDRLAIWLCYPLVFQLASSQRLVVFRYHMVVRLFLRILK